MILRPIFTGRRFFTRFFPQNRETRAFWLAVPAALIACSIAALWVVPPPALDRSRSASVLVLAADGSILRGFLTGDGKWRLPTEPAKVDPLYRRMLIAAEDRRFALHLGVDPLAASRALVQFATVGHVVSGASTLTMQAARLLEPHPRTFLAKLAEMAKALTLERMMSKDDVLGVYLS